MGVVYGNTFFINLVGCQKTRTRSLVVMYSLLLLLVVPAVMGVVPEFAFTDGTIGDLRTVTIQNSATGEIYYSQNNIACA